MEYEYEVLKLKLNFIKVKFFTFLDRNNIMQLYDEPAQLKESPFEILWTAFERTKLRRTERDNKRFFEIHIS